MGSEQNDGTSFPLSEPKLCVNGCGFFGTAANMNLCSKCYRDLRVKEEQAASAKAAIEKSLVLKPHEIKAGGIDPLTKTSQVQKRDAARTEISSTSSSSEVAAAPAEGDRAPEGRPANRCFSCNKKVGLTGFRCKCGSMFCGSHRYPENHECTFDFRDAGRSAIAKANPVVKADKVERI